MRRFAKTVVLLCILSGAVLSYGQDAAASVPSKEEVLKFMEVLRIRPQLTQYFDAIAKQAKTGAEEGLRHKIPDATPAQLAEVDQFAEGLFKDMPVDEMIDAMVPIYQRHLTKDDLQAILAFYSSPVGEKLQREQPAMMQEGMQVGGEIGRRRLGTVMQQMDEFIEKMAKENQKRPNP